MIRRLRPRSVYDLFAIVALVVATGGTGAYAANTVFSSDIVDGEVGSADVKDNSINTFDVHSFLGADVIDNSLTGADINESSLNLPQVPTTVSLATPTDGVEVDTTPTKIIGKNLVAGGYAIWATANLNGSVSFTDDSILDSDCELRLGSSFIGGASDRRKTDEDQLSKISLSMNAGVVVPAGGGEVSLWCSEEGGAGLFVYGQMMVMRVDGFF